MSKRAVRSVLSGLSTLFNLVLNHRQLFFASPNPSRLFMIVRLEGVGVPLQAHSLQYYQPCRHPLGLVIRTCQPLCSCLLPLCTLAPALNYVIGNRYPIIVFHLIDRYCWVKAISQVAEAIFVKIGTMLFPSSLMAGAYGLMSPWIDWADVFLPCRNSLSAKYAGRFLVNLRKAALSPLRDISHGSPPFRQHIHTAINESKLESY